jgi:putative oxidoreductase
MKGSLTMSSQMRMIITWVLRVVVAALFAFAGFMKLSGSEQMVQEFAVVGLGDWFRLFTGAVEIIGALAVLYPLTTAWGALLLFCVDIGAFIAQVSRIHQDWVHTIVIGAVLVALLYLTRDAVLNRISSKSA